MKKFTTYSALLNSLITLIEKNYKEYISIDNKNVTHLDSAIGLKVSTELHGSKGKSIRLLLKLVGITINNSIVHIVNTKDDIVKSSVSQISPISVYVSKGFLDRFSKSVNSESTVSSNNSESISRFVFHLGSSNKLQDYLMKLITDRQYYIVNDMKNKNSNYAQIEHTNKEAALKEEVQRLKKQLEKNNVSCGSDELFIERIEDSINNVAPSLKFITEKWKGDKTFNHNESATEVLHISDWHIGETDNINGFNKFNYNIACERVKTLTNKVISWTKMHRSMYKVDELVIIATGDMISGDIHNELIATNEFPAPEQCVKASMLISKMVNELSSFFKKIRVEYIVADNHSRTTKKIEFAPGTNSYNYIVGTMSKILLKDNDNVEFNLYPEIQHVVKIEGLKYLITHGNSIRGGFAGIPYYGMNRKLGAEALIRMNMPEDSHFNRIVMGHYHTPFMNNAVEMTGCLSSTTAFDHAAGRHSPACQTAWLVSKKFEMDYSIFWLS